MLCCSEIYHCLQEFADKNALSDWSDFAIGLKGTIIAAYDHIHLAITLKNLWK
jgi:hypothetical protein